MKIKESFDLNRLAEIALWCEDSGGYFIYNGFDRDTIKSLNIYKYNRKIEFINGEFSKGIKIINNLKRMGAIEDDYMQIKMTDFIK